ncbi:MAG TPA: hypothetical protein VGM38_04940 [Pseudolysinimonas sp.]
MSDERSESAPTAAAALPGSRSVMRSVPWVAIVALTAAVQFVRAAPIDGVVFAVVAVALLADAIGLIPRTGPLARPGIVPVMIAALVAALLLTLTPRHGIVDGIVLVGVGLAAVIGGWRGVRPAIRPAAATDRRRARGPRPGDGAAVRHTAILWAAVAVATCAWELTSFVFGRLSPEQKAQHPAISDLLDPAIDQLWSRALFVVAWIALGLALLSRGGRR